jgi:hypothetical protein
MTFGLTLVYQHHDTELLNADAYFNANQANYSTDINMVPENLKSFRDCCLIF